MLLRDSTVANTQLCSHSVTLMILVCNCEVTTELKCYSITTMVELQLLTGTPANTVILEREKSTFQ
jgi:hypothetical protein